MKTRVHINTYVHTCTHKYICILHAAEFSLEQEKIFSRIMFFFKI